jgi:hypothetical protein
MTNPPSTPSGFTAEAGLVLDCPVPACGGASEGLGNGDYQCIENEEHKFTAGECPVCGSIATTYRKRFRCTKVKSHKAR